MKQAILSSEKSYIRENHILFDRFIWIYSLFSIKISNFAVSTTNN